MIERESNTYSAPNVDELPLIEFTVRGSASTQPDFSEHRRHDIAPVGCIISDYLDVLRIFNRALFVGEVSCWVGSERAEPNRVILPGDELTIVRDEARLPPARLAS